MFKFVRRTCTIISFFMSFLVFIFLTFPASGFAGVTIDGSLDGPAQTLSGPYYDINPEHGRLINGTNLFHSFGEFNINAGEWASFYGNAAIQNVIARITGGSMSTIDGGIYSDMPVADFYFINPHGFLFGPNAYIYVGGSFHVSTADYIALGDNGIFYADPVRTDVLTAAPPSAFGFLSSAPAGVTANAPYFLGTMAEGETLSIVSGDIDIKGYPAPSTDPELDPSSIFNQYGTLTAPGGTINLVSVASAGEVKLDAPDLGMNSFSKLGDITLSEGAKLDVLSWIGSSAGTVVIRGGKLSFKDGGIDVYGNPGGTVDIKGNSLHLDNFYIFAATYGENDHPGVACSIDLTGNLLMTHASLIDSQNGPNYVDEFEIAGRGGDINISAANVVLGDDQIDENSFTDNFGFYGYISAAADGTGKTGNINITAGNAIIQNGFSVTAQTFYYGDTGDVVLHANESLQILNAGNIGILALYAGNGGNVDINSPDILISAANRSAVTMIDAETGIFAQTDYASNGGMVSVTADSLRVLDGGRISTSLLGWGLGASVEIDANDIMIDGYVVDDGINYLSSIDGRVYGDLAYGVGGNIDVTTKTLSLSNGGAVRTGLDAYAPGQAGNIVIDADVINIASRGRIYADSLEGLGSSGHIDIKGGSLTITGAKGVPLPPLFDFDFTGLSTATQEGVGGNIDVDLTGDLLLTQKGAFTAETSGPGNGGDITVAARNATLTDEGFISSASYGTGDAGNVSVTVKDTFLMRKSQVTTEAMESDGGDIFINAPYMVRLVDSKITTSVGGGPETTGGNISIDPEFVILKNSQIIANAFEGQGGNIDIVADVFLADPDSVVDASSQLGIDGQVDIQSPITHISSLVTPLSKDFRSVVALLRQPCIARMQKGEYSSLMIKGRTSLPLEPGRFLSSPLSNF